MRRTLCLALLLSTTTQAAPVDQQETAPTAPPTVQQNVAPVQVPPSAPSSDTASEPTERAPTTPPMPEPSTLPEGLGAVPQEPAPAPVDDVARSTDAPEAAPSELRDEPEASALSGSGPTEAAAAHDAAPMDAHEDHPSSHSQHPPAKPHQSHLDDEHDAEAPAPAGAMDLSTQPVPASEQAPTTAASEAQTTWLSGFPLPARGPVPAVTWAIWVVFWTWLSGIVGRMHERTTPESTVSSLLRLLQQGARGAAIASALLALGAILPAPLAALIPVMLIGAALAMGWSLVTWLPDIWGGVLLAVEQPLEPGQWIRVGSAEGEVQWVGMRSTLIKDRSGRTMRIPNSALINGPLSIDEVPWPAATVTLETPSAWSDEQARTCIEDAVQMSAFLAPGEDVSILQIHREPPTWTVTSRIVDTCFADDFQATLLAHVRAVEQPAAETP